MILPCCTCLSNGLDLLLVNGLLNGGLGEDDAHGNQSCDRGNRGLARKSPVGDGRRERLLIPAKTSPGAAMTFINRPASDIAGAGGAGGGGSDVGDIRFHIVE